MSRRLGNDSSAVPAAIDAAGPTDAPPATLLLALGGAVVASAAILFYATGSGTVALAFVLAAGVMLGGVVLLDRMRGAPTSEAEIEWQPEGVVVTRPGHSVAVMLVGQDMIAFLDEIATWPTLGEAAAALLETSPEANLAELFSQLLVQGALCRAPTPTQKESP